MLKKLQANFAFRRLVFGLLFILFSVIFVESCAMISEGPGDMMSGPGKNTMLCVIPGVILLSGFLYFTFRRIEQIRIRNVRKVMWGIGTLILFGQFLFLFFLIKDGFEGVTDTYRVIGQSIAMEQDQNGLLDNHNAYFERYGNNYPFTVILYYLFKVIKFLGGV